MGEEKITHEIVTFTRRYYLTFFIIVLLSIISYVALDQSIKKVSRYADIINTSGKELMLSQRINFFLNKFASTDEPARHIEYRREILSDLSHFKKNYAEIREFNKLDKVNNDLLFRDQNPLHKQLAKYIADVDTILALEHGELNANLPLLLEVNDLAAYTMLANLNILTSNYQDSFKKANTRLEYIEISIIASSWLGILLLCTSLFRFINKRLKKEIQKIKNKADEVDQEKSRLQAILHTIVDGVFTADQNGNLVSINPAIESITGYNAKDIIGKPFSYLFHKSSRKKNSAFYESFLPGGSEEYVRKITEQLGGRKNGNSYPAEIAINVLNSKGEKTLVGIIRDISKRKELEATLEKTKDDALMASKAKSEFLAAMSHEIRTPMNGILGMTGLLMETEMSMKQRHYSKSVMTSANSLLLIINDILDLSKIEADKLSLEQIPLDLEQTISEIAEMMSMSVEDKGLEIITEFDTNVPKYVKGDPVRIRQVLNNLISNAIKFTEKGHIHIEANLLEQEDGVSEISVAISDTGIGIPKDKLDLIFNKFDQADMSTTRKFGGTGLGLSICKRLTNLMGGDVFVESDFGHGTKFWFTMKLKETAPLKSDESFVAPPKIDVARILLVDDNPIATRVAKAELKDTKLKVTAADSAHKALQLIKDNNMAGHPYDLVITDYLMPKVDGVSFAQLVRENKDNQDLLMMLCTSKVSMGKTQILEKNGFNGYLLKPLKQGALKVMAAKLIAEKRNGKHTEFLNIHKITEIQQKNTIEKIEFVGMKALIAEDNFINQQIALEILKKYKIEVTTTNNGLEAFEAMKRNSYDIILMDCHMPKMDGFEATQSIREYEQEKALQRTPIIAFTASVLKSDLNKCVEYGMDDFLTKPIDKAALEKVLAKWYSEKLQQADLAENSALHLPTFDALKNKASEALGNTVEHFISSSRMAFDKALNSLQTMQKKEILSAISPMLALAREIGASEIIKIGEEIEVLAKKGKAVEEKLVEDLKTRIANSYENLSQELSKVL